MKRFSTKDFADILDMKLGSPQKTKLLWVGYNPPRGCTSDLKDDYNVQSVVCGAEDLEVIDSAYADKIIVPASVLTSEPTAYYMQRHMWRTLKEGGLIMVLFRWSEKGEVEPDIEINNGDYGFESHTIGNHAIAPYVVFKMRRDLAKHFYR